MVSYRKFPHWQNRQFNKKPLELDFKKKIEAFKQIGRFGSSPQYANFSEWIEGIEQGDSAKITEQSQKKIAILSLQNTRKIEKSNIFFNEFW